MVGPYHCPICRDKFNEPRCLSCLHHFCTNCLQQHIDKSGDPELDTFDCPCCQKYTAPFNNSKPIAEWANTFPIDNVIVNNMEIFDTYKKMNLPPELRCNVCYHQNDVHVDATAFCRDCKIDLCRSCSLKHKQDHNIMVNRNWINSSLLEPNAPRLISTVRC